MHMLDQVPYTNLVKKRQIKWLDYKKCRP
uniref:Uncharacterized protein n=1 Tax=Bracon brevicornis TaxID=1563983 RepID=A0A6V7IK66_9HYME